MIPAVFTFWALSVPMGFLAGDVFAHQNIKDPDTKKILPFAAAVFPPLGAILAGMAMAQAMSKENDE